MKQHRHNRVPVWLPWAIIAAFPLLAWCAVFFLGLQSRTSYRETGDGLLDWYITTCEANFAQNSFDRGWSYSTSISIGLDQIKAVEDEFSADPRYWELRAKLCRDLRIPLIGEDESREHESLAEPDFHSIVKERGKLSGSLAYLIFTSYYRVWQSESMQNVDLAGIQTFNPRDPKLIKARREALESGPGGELFRDLLREFCEEAAEDSTPYYVQALLAAQYQNYDSAVDFLRRGNAAPDNTVLSGFPGSELRELLADDVNRSYADMALAYPEPDLIATFSGLPVLDQLIEHLAENDDLAGLAVVHEFACRYGLREGARTWDSARCLHIFDELVNVNGRNQYNYSINLGGAASRYNRMRDDLRTEYSVFQNKTSFPIPFSGKTGWEFALMVVDTLCTYGVAFEFEQVAEANRNLLDREQAYNDAIYPLLREMQLFDFETLSFQDEE